MVGNDPRSNNQKRGKKLESDRGSPKVQELVILHYYGGEIRKSNILSSPTTGGYWKPCLNGILGQSQASQR